jgi:FtsH-binding integral membrane protein
MLNSILDYFISGANFEFVSIAIAAIILILIAFTIGKKRHIGLEWSFLLCFAFSLFSGLVLLLAILIVSNSPKRNLPAPEFTKKRLALGIFLLVFSLLSIYGTSIKFPEDLNENTDINALKTGFSILVISI